MKKALIIGAVVFIGYLAITWAITVGLVWLICLCFSLQFNWLIATGIWFAICLLKSIFGGNK